MFDEKLSNWNATKFFENLTRSNRLASAQNFIFCRVSGLEGFEEALGQMQSAYNFVCVSDIADGYTELNNSPRTRRVKTVFFAMRHAIDDMAARANCFDVMQELFRQFMSVLILERVKLEQNCIYLDPRITFNEIDRYFFSGCACAFFQVAIDRFTDMRYNEEEWIQQEDPHIVYYLNLRDCRPINVVGSYSPVKITTLVAKMLNISASKIATSVSNQVPFSLAFPDDFDVEYAREILDDYNADYTITINSYEFKLFAPPTGT